MPRKKIVDACHICGTVTNLTFEHVPPRAAFNDRPIVGRKFEELLQGDIDKLNDSKGQIFQRGLGSYTLCSDCNSKTGAFYGNAFVDWAYQGLCLSEHAEIAPSLYHVFQIFPLRIIKQIICMFFSVNHSGFNRAHPELVSFVLKKEHKYLPSKIKIYAFFNRSSKGRQHGITGNMNFFSRDSLRLFSEVAFPPFGYVLSINSPPPDGRLTDISYFANYKYNEWKDIPLKLPILPVYSPMPGDYRDRETIAKQMAENDPFTITNGSY